MILSMVLAAAKPWTHWLAPPLLVGSILYLVAVGVAYYCKVQAPWYRSRLLRQLQPRAASQPRPVTQLRPQPAAGRAGRGLREAA
ncbi:MAG: hypothetical protein ACLGI3_10665 [Actinomycetes bacterium]